MRVEERTTDGEEVAVARVFDFDYAPGVLAGTSASVKVPLAFDMMQIPMIAVEIMSYRPSNSTTSSLPTIAKGMRPRNSAFSSTVSSSSSSMSYGKL